MDTSAYRRIGLSSVVNLRLGVRITGSERRGHCSPASPLRFLHIDNRANRFHLWLAVLS
jgi:hypothetical protein